MLTNNNLDRIARKNLKYSEDVAFFISDLKVKR